MDTPSKTGKTSPEPRRLPNGPHLLANAVKEHTHPSIGEPMIRAVISPTLAVLSQLARANHADRALLPATAGSGGYESVALADPTWETVAEWLVSLAGRNVVMPQRETTAEEVNLDELSFRAE